MLGLTVPRVVLGNLCHTTYYLSLKSLMSKKAFIFHSYPMDTINAYNSANPTLQIMRSVSPPAPRPTTILTLLGLPPEIRNYIFTLLLVENEPLTANVCFINMQSGYRSRPGPPPLARVSRQLRHEAISIFYGHNIFSFIPPRGYVCGHQDASPFKWRLGLLNYTWDIPKQVRHVFLDIRTPHTRLITNIAQSSSGDITIDLRVEENSSVSSSIRRDPCVCGFEDIAPGAIRQWALDESEKLFQIAECFFRRCAMEPKLFTGDKEGKRRCSNSLGCGKGGKDRASLLICGNNKVQLISN